jgi:hypothetical protein
LWIQSVIVKIYQQAFLATLPGTNNHGDDAKKYQEAFLAPLPGMALVKRFTNT